MKHKCQKIRAETSKKGLEENGQMGTKKRRHEARAGGRGRKERGPTSLLKHAIPRR